MTIHVKLFAAVRERLGGEVIAIEVPPGAVVADLHQALARRFPDAQNLLARCAVVLDQAYARADQPIAAASEVALLPPVSGG